MLYEVKLDEVKQESQGTEEVNTTEHVESVNEKVDVVDTPVDIVSENKKLENYDVILEKFTDILTLSENRLIVANESDIKKNILSLGLDVFTLGVKFCETGSTEDLFKFIAKNFEYLGMYLFTFSGEDSTVGILTSKIDNLLYDYIGNQFDILHQFNVFQSNFKGSKENDLKSLVSPLMFNLSNLGTNIACIKSIMHYIRLDEERTTESILEDVILHIEK